MTKEARQKSALERRKCDLEKWEKEGNSQKIKICKNDIKALQKKLGVSND